MTRLTGGSEIFFAFENGNVLNNVLFMDISQLLRTNPCLVIRKFINARTIAEFIHRDNEARVRVSRVMYSDLRCRRKQIGNRSLFTYQIPKISVLNALFAFTTEVSIYSHAKRDQIDDLSEEAPLPNDVSDDRREQIQYARSLWHDIEIQCRNVWRDGGWATLVDEMNEQMHPIFNFFPKPSFYFDEDEEIEYFPSPDEDEEDVDAYNATSRHNIERDIQLLAKRVLVGNHWFLIGGMFYAVTSRVAGEETVMIENEAEVRLFALS